jgi:glutathione peroxidase
MMNRRHLLALGVAALPALRLGAARATAMNATVNSPMSSRVTAYAFTFKGLDGGDILLASYAGHPILIVNTASLCGYTPQYAGLQELWTRYHERGLMIIGVPSNDFGGQEPAGASDIHATAQGEYHVTFPLTEKAAVKGSQAHPFYRWAAQERPLDAPRWNFHKYLIGRDGHLEAAFTSAVEPSDPRVIAAIEAELAGE